MVNVVAVTVTYNSSDLLKRCVDSLKSQTYKLLKIVIVDNNSKEEHKNKNQLLVDDQVELVYLNENTGGAGGFEAGMKHAYEKYNPDFVWIMDDDAFPKDDCLEKLLAHTDYENVGCICPAIFGVEYQKFQTYHHKKVTKTFNELQAYVNYEDMPDVFEIDANAFVGPLITRKAIETVGVADGSLFIYGDDTEYTYRLTRKFKMIVVKDAIIQHRDVTFADAGKINPKVWWKDYYMYRNRFLFNYEFATSSMQRFKVKFRLRKELLVKMWSVRLRKKFKGYRKYRLDMYKKAIKDGLNQRRGKLVDPVTYINSLPKEK